MFKKISLLFACFLFFSVKPVTAQVDYCEGNFDYDKDVDGTDASLFKSDFGRSALKNPCPPDGPSPVQKTGQLPLYQVYDDGWYHNGLAWPNPRFTDNGNGTVTDNLTGLIWLKNANCFGLRTWSQALSDCNGLASGFCGLTDNSIAGNWRLPNVFELESLRNMQYYNPALSNAAGTGHWQEGDSFTSVQNFLYWSSTTFTYSTDHAFYVSIYDGVTNRYDKTSTYYVWPVRGGRGNIPEGLVSYWRFDEGEGTTAFDSVGGNNATINGAAWTTGRANDALSFDGDHYVEGDKSSIVGITQGTIETWIKPSEITWDNWFFSYAMDSCLGIGLDVESDGAVGYQLDTCLGSPSGSPGAVSIGNWYHIAMTWDGGNVKIYVNGSLYLNDANSGFPKDAASSIKIGVDSFNRNGASFRGIIDEVAVYYRVLSLEELQQHYQRGLNGQGYY